jgi:hypothetical protein
MTLVIFFFLISVISVSAGVGIGWLIEQLDKRRSK